MATAAIERARAVLRERLDEIERERQELTHVLEQLESSKRSGSAARSSRRARRGERRAEMLALLRENPETRPSEAARLLGISASQVSNLLRSLQDENALRRRGSGWQVVA